VNIQPLIKKKNEWACLEGQDALQFLRYIRSSSSDWTNEHYEQLIRFMLGKPVRQGYRFEVMAGKPIQQVDQSDAHQTVVDRFEARRARKAARQQRWRLSKLASQLSINQ
jgi:hypothetical protein